MKTHNAGISRKQGLKPAGAFVVCLGLLVAAAFADNFYTSVYGSTSGTYDSGVIYSVPAGANYEWEVSAGGYAGYARLMLGGGGLNVNLTAGPGDHYYDVNSTSYADTISYSLSAYIAYPGYDSSNAMFWIGW